MENRNDNGSEVLSQWTNLNLTDMNRALRGEDPNPPKREAATAESWNTTPMPWRNAVVKLNVMISGEDFKSIEMGHIPQEMEDHWFMYCEETPGKAGGYIRWFRSWSGFCIFEASYERRGDDVALVSLKINRKSDQYSSRDKVADTNLFLAMMAWEIGADPEEYWKEFWERTKPKD